MVVQAGESGMARLASSTVVSRRNRLLLTSAVALALIALPVGIGDGPFLAWQTVLAKSDNGNGGNGGNAGGNGNGRGNGRGGGHGVGHGQGDEEVLHGRERAPGRVGGAGNPHDVQEFVDGLRSGKAFGFDGYERRDARLAAARQRYDAALGRRDRNPGSSGRPGRDTETVAYGFSAEETSVLIERGWRGPKTGGSFRNHGERTRTMVELSKQLGFGAHVGAMQANFGTPFENGIADLQAALDAARAEGDDEEAQRLEGELATAIRDAKPGTGPDDGWASADLDVNDDQLVDRRDLEDLARIREEQLAGETW
jgi:hypothetical protein